MVIILKFKNVH